MLYEERSGQSCACTVPNIVHWFKGVTDSLSLSLQQFPLVQMSFSSRYNQRD